MWEEFENNYWWVEQDPNGPEAEVWSQAEHDFSFLFDKLGSRETSENIKEDLQQLINIINDEFDNDTSLRDIKKMLEEKIQTKFDDTKKQLKEYSVFGELKQQLSHTKKQYIETIDTMVDKLKDMKKAQEAKKNLEEKAKKKGEENPLEQTDQETQKTTINVLTDKPATFEAFNTNFEGLAPLQQQMYAVRLFADKDMQTVYNDMIAISQKNGVSQEVWTILNSYIEAQETMAEKKGEKLDIQPFASLDDIQVTENWFVIGKGQDNMIHFAANEGEVATFTKHYETKYGQAEEASKTLQAATWQSLKGRQKDLSSWLNALRNGKIGKVGDIISWLMSSFTAYLRTEEGKWLNSLLQFMGRQDTINELNTYFPPTDEQIAAMEADAKVNEWPDEHQALLREEWLTNSHKQNLMNMTPAQRNVLIKEKDAYSDNRILRNAFLTNPAANIPTVLDPSNYEEKQEAQPNPWGDDSEKPEQTEKTEHEEKTKAIWKTSYSFETSSFGEWDNKTDYITSSREITENDTTTKYKLPLFDGTQIIQKGEEFYTLTTSQPEEWQEWLQIKEEKITKSDKLAKISDWGVENMDDLMNKIDDPKEKWTLIRYALTSPDMAKTCAQLTPEDYKKFIPLIQQLKNTLLTEDGSVNEKINDEKLTEIMKNMNTILTKEEYEGKIQNSFLFPNIKEWNDSWDAPAPDKDDGDWSN